MTLSDAAANSAANTVCRLMDGRTISVLTSSGTTLAELRFSSPAFAPAVNGKAKAHKITDESSAKATGRASHFVVAGVMEGTVGTEDADLVLDSVDIEKDAIVSIESVTYEQPR